MLGGQKYPPSGLHSLVGLPGFAGEVVVVQVLVRHRSELLQPLSAEQAALLEGFDQAGTFQQQRKHVVAVHQQPLQPAQVIETGVVESDPVVASDHQGGGSRGHQLCSLEGFEHAPGQADGGVADSDHPVAQDPGAHFGDDPGWVGEVDQMSPGGQAGDCFGDPDGGGDAAQRVVQASETGGLLPEDLAAVGDGLLGGAALGAADPDGAEDEVGSGHGLVQVLRHLHLRGLRMSLGHRLQDGADHGQASCIGVPEPQLGDPAVALVGKQGAKHQRHAETTAT